MDHPVAEPGSHLRSCPPRPRLAAVVLLAATVLAPVLLSQCRLVNDTITGVDLNAPGTLNGHSDCVHQCNERYKADKRAEEARHHAAQAACGSNLECRRAEHDLHEANEEQLKLQKKACKRGCYDEGGGGGGR